MKRKNRPLCETPRSGYFCGPDKYLRLQEHTISEELFPVMEVDSYFVLVRSGSGSFIINGEEFPVQPGCVAWIQCSQVLTICPEFGEALKIWVAAFDYQLLSYYMLIRSRTCARSRSSPACPSSGRTGTMSRRSRGCWDSFGT
ncbi:MAG: hypothetical protein ACLTG4_13365 [Oscillospiraceae bacterium]